MHYVNGIIACVLLAFAAAQFNDPSDTTLLFSFAGGALLAILSLQHSMSLFKARTLAVLTTTAMFFYFAGFFTYCPDMASDWYLRDRSMDLMGLLFAGFAMIPVLSVYSCWMKAECHMHRPASSRRHGVSEIQESHAR